MSVAEVGDVVPVAARRGAAALGPFRRLRADLRFLRSELWLIFGRRRNWAGLAVLVSVPLVIAISVEVSPPDGGAGDPGFFSSIVENGLFVALASLTLELPLFLPLAVAAISADSVAGEANLGTLRYLLAVPVSRTRLLAVKFLAVGVFAAAATLLVAAVGAVLGLVLFGGGSATLPSGDVVPSTEVLVRLGLICGYLSLGLWALGALGLFVSTLTEQPVAATVAIVTVSTASFVLDSIPQLDWLHPYLLTHHWLVFPDLVLEPVPGTRLATGLFCAGVYAAVFWLAAWARLGGRDVTS
jgi:ABC-2 type transport system permease protein